MPQITAIKKQKFSNRVSVYLDDKFGFGTDLETLVKSNLKVGIKLTEEEIAIIKGTSDFQSTLNKLLNFATIRPRSGHEVESWLKRKKINEDFHQKLFEKLTKLELLDDRKFATWWVGQRQSFRPKSKKELQYELLQKGINKSIISNVLEDSEIDEVKIAKNLVEKNSYKWARFDEKKKKQKISEYLGRKGFSWEIIKNIRVED